MIRKGGGRWLAQIIVVVLLSGCIIAPLNAGTDDEGGPVPRASSMSIPRLPIEPKLDEQLGAAEWRDAAVVTGEFVITTGGLSDGTYPFTLWIGCTDRGLHLALKIEDAGMNPHDGLASPTGGESEEIWWSDLIIFLFSPRPSGPLQTPSDAYHVWHRHQYGNGGQDGYWDGIAWRHQQNGVNGDFEKGQPTTGRWFRGGFEDPSLLIEGFIAPDSPMPEFDGLRLQSGDAFRMALLFARLREEPPEDAERDVWPGDGFTPEADKDPTAWPVFTYTC